MFQATANCPYALQTVINLFSPLIAVTELSSSDPPHRRVPCTDQRWAAFGDIVDELAEADSDGWQELLPVAAALDLGEREGKGAQWWAGAWACPP